MADSSSGRNALNSGSDSAKHHRGTASQQYESTVKTGPAVPTTAPGGSCVRDNKPTGMPSSAVK